MILTGKIIRSFAVAIFAIACVVGVADAAGWGSIKGRFLVDGNVPPPAALNASSDAYCVPHKPMDETIVVGDGGALANVVVFLRADKKLEIHPDYEKTATEKVTLDNNGCAFH